MTVGQGWLSQTQVIDGLKARSYGLKKSLEEKEQRINNIYERGDRYYPAS